MPSTAQNPLKVFLCHARSDQPAVQRLYTRLVKDNVDAWLDKDKLLPGQDWELEIRKAVREADVVVVCLSKQFNQAGFRQKEVRLALDTAMEKPEGEIFIIPARLEECDNLESLRKWHWVDLFEEDGYEMLMRALRARADRIGAILQTKKGWLPTGNTQPPVIKKPLPPTEKPVEEKPKPNLENRIQKNFNRNIIEIIGFIVLVLVSVFGLPPLIEKPEQTPTTTARPSATITPILFISMPRITSTLTPTKTQIPSFDLSKLHDIKGTASPIISLSFSPDSKMLLSGAGDGVVRIWDVEKGNLLNTITGNYWGYLGVWYAFSADGKYLASGSWNDLSVKLVQIDNNSVVNSFASKDNGPAISIAMSHDGEMLAVSYWVDDVVRLWKVDNKKLLHTLAEGGRKISFSYDNSMVGILYGKELKVWNTSNGQVVYSLTDNVESFSFSPENDMLVLGLSDGTISLRRFLDGSLVSTLSGHTSSVQSLAFSSDGKILASASSDETIKLWDMLNKKLLRSVNSNVGGISYLIFSKDGQLLASGADDGTTTLWSLTR